MKNWQEDLLNLVDCAGCEHVIFEKIRAAALALSFEYCAYGLRDALPLSNPKISILSNYPIAWQKHYHDRGYLDTDPTVLHGRRTQTPLIWSDTTFVSSQRLWEDARAFGLRVGWAQSSLTGVGVGGMLTLARSYDEISASELAHQEMKMRWLVTIAHMTLSKILTSRMTAQTKPTLTAREVEVLKWTADGKTSGEISSLLAVSENTINFHLKNVIFKMQASNKTAAVVRAVMLGLLF